MANALIGMTIVEMKIASDRRAILFLTSNGLSLVARMEADCCSSTWVESIEMPALGLPFTVAAIENLDMGKEPLRDETFDHLQFYGAKILTDKGDIVIDYRNESNGYYGGDISWPGDRFYGGVFDQNVSKEDWVDIKDAG